MLCVAACHDLQDLAQALCRASQANKRGIDHQTVELAHQIRHTQYRPPYHKLIDLPNKIGLEMRERTSGQSHQAGCAAAVEPVRVEADGGHRVEVLQKQKKA